MGFWPSRGGGAGRRRRSLLSSTAALLLLLLFVAASLTGHRTSASRVVVRVRRGGGATRQTAEEEYTWEDPVSSSTRRGLVGPGSSPPTCRSRCGGCRPCRPVHVAIQPGMSFTLEYYPEAWRCKCGNKLFMP